MKKRGPVTIKNNDRVHRDMQQLLGEFKFYYNKNVTNIELLPFEL